MSESYFDVSTVMYWYNCLSAHSVISAARGLTLKQSQNMYFDDQVKKHGIVGVVVFTVKQPPLQMQIYLT